MSGTVSPGMISVSKRVFAESGGKAIFTVRVHNAPENIALISPLPSKATNDESFVESAIKGLPFIALQWSKR